MRPLCLTGGKARWAAFYTVPISGSPAVRVSVKFAGCDGAQLTLNLFFIYFYNNFECRTVEQRNQSVGPLFFKGE